MKDTPQQLPSRSRRNLAVSVAILLMIVLGCLGSSRTKCTGELVVDGKTYNGVDDNEAEARRNTCAKYCIEGDPEMDAMFNIWYDALPAEKKKRVRKNEKGKWDALYDSDAIKKYVEKCEKRCLDSENIPVKCSG